MGRLRTSTRSHSHCWASTQNQPVNGTNHFTLSFMSAPYIPHLTKPSGKDTVFLTLSGSRSSNPDDFYATVPTDAERTRRFFRCRIAADLRSRHRPAIHLQRHAQRDSAHGSRGISRSLHRPRRSCSYFPEPNLPAGSTINGYNYHLLTTAQSNTTQAGIRYNRSLGANATQPGGRGWSRAAAGAADRRIRAFARASISTTTGLTRPRIW